jgi:hypothetical protein
MGNIENGCDTIWIFVRNIMRHLTMKKVWLLLSGNFRVKINPKSSVDDGRSP